LIAEVSSGRPGAGNAGEGLTLEHHYVALASGGDVHYLRSGTGPPVLVLHASPMSSRSMTSWIQGLETGFTVFAPDTAGFGQSDPLPYGGRSPTIGDYARRVVEFADAVRVDRFVLSGTHTGSKIALETAVQAPSRVAQLVMDGLGLYSPEERDDQLARYTPPIVPVWHGGHLVEVWHRLRNMWTFWPWYRQEAERRLDDSVPPPEVLHEMALDMLRARPDWGLAYRAAFRYDGRAALARLAVPAVLVAKEADPLHEHLGRLGTAPDTLSVRSVADADHLSALMAGHDRSLDLPPAPPAPPREHDGGTTRQYVPTSGGLVHVRMSGAPGAEPLLVLHGCPGSADSLEDLIADLASDRLVIAPDIPGNGYSDLPAVAEPDVGHLADGIADVLDGLGLGPVPVYGRQAGACIAIELAIRRPASVSALVLDDLPLLDDQDRLDVLRNGLVPLSPQRHGEHLVRAWHLVRDAELWSPWWSQDAAHRLPTAPSDPERLHRLTLEVLKGGDGYRAALRAAVDYPALRRLEEVRVPVLPELAQLVGRRR
jgi:pimeloyl-ACP methyl ester carboxylesterase